MCTIVLWLAEPTCCDQLFCVSVCVCECCTGNALHSRYADLKQVVLDELLAQHGDAQLDAQLHKAARMSTLGREEEKNKE